MAVYVYTVEKVEPLIQTTLDAAFRDCQHLLQFRDIGIDDPVAQTFVATYEVSQAGISRQPRGLFEERVDIVVEIPVLRIFGVYHPTDQAILSQVMHKDVPPTMGKTAKLVRPGAELDDIESWLAIAAFRELRDTLREDHT